ncbi:hypothetical protein HF1_09210 [Mycoplasma haemofelis str. Langford 1]|uniref:Uncharacterized protein n=1 Tax=Mycoplasma haemofelis (strain Langford 1) TaxID=941640 RepID=E8ZIF8_MYCHL|nr:hypothetical protein HF1_09210 [Mycoplasma haemofelis str. Langford 1]
MESGGSDYWVKFKELYKNFKGEKLVGVSESALPQWCEDILKSKVSSREHKEIDFASKWCVVDTRSLKEVVKSSGKNLISDLKSTEQAESYKKAWDYYKENKDTKKLVIVDSKFTTPEKSSNTEGGPALQTWCTDKESKLMYEYGGEDQTLEKYTTWCVKQSA